MDTEIDINKEYEKIFGVESRENIYAPDDIEYQTLRKSIINADREVVHTDLLPFNGVHNVRMVKRRSFNKRIQESRLGARKLMNIIESLKRYGSDAQMQPASLN